MVLVPSALMSSRMLPLAPLASATTLVTEAMPMMMPSMVRKVRSLCATIANSAILKAWDMRSNSGPSISGRSTSERPTRDAGTAPGTASPGFFSACVRASAVRRSETMRPSRISTIRRACAATSGSWVMTMMVWPWALSSSSNAMTSSPERVSSAPVGSSARMISPPFISARAMLVRCCWPPDSSLGR